MMPISSRTALAILLLGLLTRANALTPPRIFLLDAATLTQVKSYIHEGKEPYKSAYEALLLDAKKALTVGPFSVMDKTVTPPSGDKHDFYNYGPYWWPDSTMPDGLPYIRRDGEVNPETQVRPDGSQPKELERTKSLGYSLYNLTALFDLAT